VLQRRDDCVHYLAIALVCASCVWVAGARAGEIFRWTDDQGNLHFTSDLNQVPAQYRGQFGIAVPNGNIIAAEDGAAPSAEERLETLKERGRKLARQRQAEAARQQRSASRARDPGPEPPKYDYDCRHRTKNGRCRRFRSTAWNKWNELRQKYEAAH